MTNGGREKEEAIAADGSAPSEGGAESLTASDDFCDAFEAALAAIENAEEETRNPNAVAVIGQALAAYARACRIAAEHEEEAAEKEADRCAREAGECYARAKDFEVEAELARARAAAYARIEEDFALDREAD